jgi:hypothetical protein
LYFKAA